MMIENLCCKYVGQKWLINFFSYLSYANMQNIIYISLNMKQAIYTC